MAVNKPNDNYFNHLDGSLLGYINSEQRWEQFKHQFVRPLTITRYSAITGNVTYQGYPVNGNSLDAIVADSTFLGTSKHLLLVSLIYHMNHVKGDPVAPVCLDVASHFSVSHYYPHFSSLVKHIPDTTAQNNLAARDALLSLIRIWDPRIGDYINAYALQYDFMIDVLPDDDRLYNWLIGGSKEKAGMDENHRASTWSRHFTPLSYYNWMLPNSQLSALDFYLDANTSYMYSWLQDYLAKCRLYRIKIDELAQAVKTRDAYKKKLEQSSLTFVENNARLSDKIRAKIGAAVPADPARRKREHIQRRYLQQLSALYGKFLQQINAASK